MVCLFFWGYPALLVGYPSVVVLVVLSVVCLVFWRYPALLVGYRSVVVLVVLWEACLFFWRVVSSGGVSPYSGLSFWGYAAFLVGYLSVVVLVVLWVVFSSGGILQFLILALWACILAFWGSILALRAFILAFWACISFPCVFKKPLAQICHPSLSKMVTSSKQIQPKICLQKWSFWLFGPSFPFILSFWAFIFFHFGLLGFHFLSFWPSGPRFRAFGSGAWLLSRGSSGLWGLDSPRVPVTWGASNDEGGNLWACPKP